METITLNIGTWLYDESKTIGEPGGFGEVFEGDDGEGNPVAVKRLKVTGLDTAHRELRVAEEISSGKYSRAINILDYGEDIASSRYFIVMPIADESLDAYLRRVDTISESDGIELLLEFSKALEEAEKIIHRDLKPGNFLFHEGIWKIADFGIAKFVEDSTSANTVKSALSMKYAAPEQWKLESTSHATDVYALGCIAHTVFSGQPPFICNDAAEYKQCHTQEVPPKITNIGPKLSNLIQSLLRKPQSSRPSISRIISVLESIKSTLQEQEQGEEVETSLAKAAEAVERIEASQDAKREKSEFDFTKRSQALDAGMLILKDLVINLMDHIQLEASNATKVSDLIVSLGKATLAIGRSNIGLIPPDQFKEAGWDVLGDAKIIVTQHDPNYIWSASLFYGKPLDKVSYRWYEIGFCTNGFIPSKEIFEPRFIDDPQAAAIAMSPVISTDAMGYDPIAIDDEDIDKFLNWWMDIFAKGSLGKLKYPGFPLKRD